jgi:tetratricopeptide (TPR) repeat protein
VASLQLGRALRLAGRAAEALPRLAEAEAGFAGLAEAGDEAAARMLAVVAADRGDALRDLGRLDEAAESQQHGIEIDERTGNRRSAAAGRFQLGTVRLLQGRLLDAMEAYEKARETFEELGERGSVATTLHQIGRVLETAGQWDGAEAAYQRSLRLEVESGNRSGEASSLSQLGTLYAKSGRLEESARLYRQAATLYEELGDPFPQARSLSNLASALRELGRLEDARGAALQTVQLEAPFGHAAEPWKTWDILQEIETRSGNPEAAAAARSRAMELYAAYRRDGGEPQSSAARLIATAGRALRESGAAAARLLIPPEPFDEGLLPVCDALVALAGGSRDPALAADARLDYSAAVELSLLLDSLVAAGPPRP